MEVGAKSDPAIDDRIAASAARTNLKLARYASVDAMVLLAYMILTDRSPILGLGRRFTHAVEANLMPPVRPAASTYGHMTRDYPGLFRLLALCSHTA